MGVDLCTIKEDGCVWAVVWNRGIVIRGRCAGVLRQIRTTLVRSVSLRLRLNRRNATGVAVGRREVALMWNPKTMEEYLGEIVEAKNEGRHREVALGPKRAVCEREDHRSSYCGCP